ncbi:MAG TPA: Mur ligase family protein, partial [Limnochordia bacterium]
MPRSLEQLAAALPKRRLTRGASVPVSGICYDSRRVVPGDLFVCVRGLRYDGHDFAGEAASKGAVAIVAERELPDVALPQVIVPESRLALALLAAAFYDYPSSRLRLIGVTGTNGKTTTTHLIKAILEAAGWKTGLLGTIHNMIGDQELAATMTTPESADLLMMLDRMVNAGVRAAVMEVSSHALALQRTAGCEFDGAVLTNVTQDHLDFHPTFADYLEAKTRLFRELGD